MWYLFLYIIASMMSAYDELTEEDQEVEIFVNRLFAGRFNDQSELVKDWLENSDMHDYITHHPIYYDCVFKYVILSCFALKKYDIVLYFINKDKNRFKEYIFESYHDFVEGLAFCIDNGVILNYERLFRGLCRSGCINSIRYLVEVKNFKLLEDNFRGSWNCIHNASCNVSKEFSENSIKTINYLVGILGYNINLPAEYGETCLEIALSDKNVSYEFILNLLNLGADKTLVSDKYISSIKDNNIRELVKTFVIDDVKEPDCC